MRNIKLLLLLVLMLSAFVTEAQHKPFQFGFRGALNLGWFTTDQANFSNQGADIGGSYGFVADIYLMENYSFTTGINLLYLNGTTSQTDKAGTLERQFHSRYLQLPILFTMKTNPINDKIRIYGQIGYGISFLLQSKSVNEFTDNEGNQDRDEINTYDELTFTRSSIIIGAGVEIPIHGSTFMRTGVTFDNCFITMFKGDDFKVKHKFFELNLAVLF